MFDIPIGKVIQKQDFAYIFVAVVISYIVYASGVNLITIYALSGAIVGYIFVFAIPIGTHLKCVLVDRASGTIEDDTVWNNQIVPN